MDAIIFLQTPVYTITESRAVMLATNISITPDGKSEISTNPPMNVPRILPAAFMADNLPTTAPELFTSCMASLATKGETIPRRRLPGANIASAA